MLIYHLDSGYSSIFTVLTLVLSTMPCDLLVLFLSEWEMLEIMVILLEMKEGRNLCRRFFCNNAKLLNTYILSSICVILVFNLTNGIDVKETEERIEAYRKENQDTIKRNKSKMVFYVYYLQLFECLCSCYINYSVKCVSNQPCKPDVCASFCLSLTPLNWVCTCKASV